MTRAQAWTVHASTALVGLTGLVYGYMRYLARPADPFAIVNHPWQPALRDWHIVSAPLLVFACGWVWREHVWNRVRSGFARRRRTGLALFGLVAPMVLSGYLLQVSVEPGWRLTWIVVHVGTSCLWLGAYLVHQGLAGARRLAGCLRGRGAPEAFPRPASDEGAAVAPRGQG